MHTSVPLKAGMVWTAVVFMLAKDFVFRMAAQPCSSSYRIAGFNGRCGFV
jgi:hypothetical protein